MDISFLDVLNNVHFHLWISKLDIQCYQYLFKYAFGNTILWFSIFYSNSGYHFQYVNKNLFQLLNNRNLRPPWRVGGGASPRHRQRESSAAAVFTECAALYGSAVTVRVTGHISAAAVPPAEKQVVALTNSAPTCVTANWRCRLAVAVRRRPARRPRWAVAATVALREGFCTEAAQVLARLHKL